jgi:alpha-N-arabinofuranosidase
VLAPQIDTAAFGEVDALLSTATHDPETGELAVFAVNRSRSESLELTVDLTGFDDVHLVEHLLVHDDDSTARNTAAEPDRVVPRTGKAELVDGVLTASLPPVSWHCFRLSERNRS